MPAHPPSRYQIVLRQPGRRWQWPTVLILAWLATVAAAWMLATWRAAPELATVQQRLHATTRQLADQRAQVRELSQREATLAVSERISRAANSEIQTSLAERDEEIASLRADVAFYERLVGATGQRKGLSVHLAEFALEPGGTWQYQIMLTQTLNRGSISQGQMRFSVEGVRAGKLATVGWDELRQTPRAGGQDYSFRYFQQLDGNVMLPADFTPQRVKVQLRGEDVAVEQAFDWKLATSAGGK
jgi:hypothetical protein